MAIIPNFREPWDTCGCKATGEPTSLGIASLLLPTFIIVGGIFFSVVIAMVEAAWSTKAS